MNVDTPTPLGLSHAEAEKQRKLNVLKCHASKQLDVEYKQLRRWEAMVGVPFTLDHGPHPHRNPLTSRFFSRDLDGNGTRPSIKPFPYRTCFFLLELFCLSSIFYFIFYFYFRWMGKHPIFVVNQLSHEPILISLSLSLSLSLSPFV